MPENTYPPLQLVALIGSLRANSLNRTLFNTARELLPSEVTLTESPIGNLPLFNDDLESSGLPESVVAFRDSIRGCDGVLIFSPEYNYSIPGVLKNALDWGSRPPGQAVLSGKPVMVFGASGGRSGTLRMQMHLRNVLSNLNMPQLPKPEYYLSWAGNAIQNGVLTSEDERVLLQETLVAFLDWLVARQRA